MRNTRDMIREFNLAFGRPVNLTPTELSESDRLLLGKLIFEECVEYVTKGLGLKIVVNGMHVRDLTTLTLELNEGQRYDPIESADGLGDMNVVIHFNALWHGFNLDVITEEINDSNMSKLGIDGRPIINGVTEGYKEGQDGYDPAKPIGKILKGPNFRKPNLEPIIWAGNY